MSKASKRRSCPATGGDITPAECGEGRHSRLACPPDCLFNPFGPAHYDQLLEHEAHLDAVTMRRFIGQAEETARTDIAQAARRNPGHGLHAATVRHLFFRPAADGLTFGERWRQAGFAGLKNDERVLFQAKMRMRVALLEIHRVTDAQTVEAADLLNPGAGTLRLVDRSVAARAVRFGTLLTWIYPLPHFWRLSGTGIVLSDLGPVAPLAVVEECIAHAGGPREIGLAREKWLAENFLRLDEILTATAYARRQRMFEGMDAQFGRASYALNMSLPECRRLLQAEAAIAPDEVATEERREGLTEAMVWFDGAAVAPGLAQPGARPVRGRILLGPGKARVEAIGAARLAALRSDFETTMGAGARFESERRDDLGTRQTVGDPEFDPQDVPPGLLESPMRVELQSSRLPPPPPGVSVEEYSAQLRRQMLTALPDTPLPALDGRTPREAAAIPALRPRLLQVMKTHVKGLDEDNLRSGRTDDINFLLRELGLTEIDFPAPPAREIPADDDDEDSDGEFADDEPEEGRLPVEFGRPAAPRLSGPPLNYDQALDRLQAVMDDMDRGTDGLDELDRSGATVIDDADRLAGGRLTEMEFNILVTFLMQAWFALVPRGVRAPALHFESMEADMARTEDMLQAREQSPMPTLDLLIGRCRQPELMQALLAGLLGAKKKLPKPSRPSDSAVVVMVLVTRVVLDELDRSLRG
ncbi:MAG: hypothetical protein ACOZE5_01755 [Verrucomicrobiota bacterium]